MVNAKFFAIHVNIKLYLNSPLSTLSSCFQIRKNQNEQVCNRPDRRYRLREKQYFPGPEGGGRTGDRRGRDFPESDGCRRFRSARHPTSISIRQTRRFLLHSTHFPPATGRLAASRLPVSSSASTFLRRSHQPIASNKPAFQSEKTCIDLLFRQENMHKSAFPSGKPCAITH